MRCFSWFWDIFGIGFDGQVDRGSSRITTTFVRTVILREVSQRRKLEPVPLLALLSHRSFRC